MKLEITTLIENNPGDNIQLLYEHGLSIESLQTDVKSVGGFLKIRMLITNFINDEA